MGGWGVDKAELIQTRCRAFGAWVSMLVSGGAPVGTNREIRGWRGGGVVGCI